ncbi:phosphoesterase [Alsobacter soli]|uniref:Phosphoesterase n=1 Tax=Alsobacter soli TaxID=2109933 RepID=A0A2T1HYZ3_9HYPH|nr:phosphoesterase [Alsobacter soli]
MSWAPGEASEAPLPVGGLAFLACRSGALWLERERLLVVADLHLEKGSAFAARGRMLPPYDSRATLAALAAVVARFRPATVLVLGDGLHDGRALERIPAEDLAALRALQGRADWIWVAGNHDPVAPAGLGGQGCDEIVVGDVAFRHEPKPGETGPELAGHLHPAAKVGGRGRAVRRRCFVSNGRRCVMPAFGAYAGGLNVLDRAFAPLFGARFTAHVAGAERVYTVAPAQLRPD